VTSSTSSAVAVTVATVRQAPAVRTWTSYGASGRASSQVRVAWPSVGVPSSSTVRVLGVAGSVPGVQAVTALPSTAATAGALGSAALAVTGRQRARLSASGPAVRVGTVSGAPTETVCVPPGVSTRAGAPERNVRVEVEEPRATSNTRPCQRRPVRCRPSASCGGSIGSSRSRSSRQRRPV
jgi:hypothetical protein